jgi:hypothetical protein
LLSLFRITKNNDRFAPNPVRVGRCYIWIAGQLSEAGQKTSRLCPIYFEKTLTLLKKSGKVIKNKRDDENQYALIPFFRELPVGARQKKDRAEFLSERLC